MNILIIIVFSIIIYKFMTFFIESIVDLLINVSTILIVLSFFILYFNPEILPLSSDQQKNIKEYKYKIDNIILNKKLITKVKDTKKIINTKMETFVQENNK